MKDKLMEILKALKLLPESGYGELSLKFENGRIVFCRVTETVKM